jgi:hypothetical protein
MIPVNGIDVVLSGTFRLGLDGRYKLFVGGNGHISGLWQRNLIYWLPKGITLVCSASGSHVISISCGVRSSGIISGFSGDTGTDKSVTVLPETVKVIAVATVKVSTEC